MGPAGELRYPCCPSEKLSWAWRFRELGEFQCYDKVGKLVCVCVFFFIAFAFAFAFISLNLLALGRTTLSFSVYPVYSVHLLNCIMFTPKSKWVFWPCLISYHLPVGTLFIQFIC